MTITERIHALVDRIFNEPLTLDEAVALFEQLDRDVNAEKQSIMSTSTAESTLTMANDE